jgi:SAM-dependent methyltransferase
MERMVEPPTDSQAQMVTRYRNRQSRLYRFLRPPLPVIHNKTEVPLPPCQGIRLFIGGAGGSIPPGFVNVDMQHFPGVDIVGDVQALPFLDDSIAAIECDAVLEHVPNPTIAVMELVRVLKPGGFLHVVIPFCHPFHGYPSDYQRWTIRGMQHLLPPSTCDVLSVGIRTGPTATLLQFFCEYVRLLAPEGLGKVAYALTNWIVWPLRYLDLWLNRKPDAHILGNCFYLLVAKKGP